MKKIPYLFLIVACFVGVLAALQVDRYFDRRAAGLSNGDVVLGSTAQLIPAAYEQDPAGSVDFRAAAKRVIPSVVSVNQYRRLATMDPWGTADPDTQGRLTETGSGSGVIISDQGYIVTNNHVVSDPQSGRVVDQVRVTLDDKRTLIAKVVGTDPRSDLAVLKIDAPNLTPIALGDSTKIDVGQWVLAVGNPLGFTNTVSVGVVSSLNRSLSIQGHPLINGIQTDAAINPGNSGGALTDASGRLIGINSAIASTTRASIGIGFAIPVNRVKDIVQDIIKIGHPRYAGLGITYDPRWDGILADPRARSEIAQQTGGDPPAKGVIVGRVAPGSVAEKAGMKTYDVLMAIDGRDIEDSLSLNQALTDKKPGDKASIKFWSRGNVKTADVTLQEVGSE
jgi:serine protease Do